MQDFKTLETKTLKAKKGGGSDKVKKQHEKGKLSARDRLSIMLDENSFQEYDKFIKHRASDFGMQNGNFLGDGVVIGHGTVYGRKFLFILRTLLSLVDRLVHLMQKKMQNYGYGN